MFKMRLIAAVVAVTLLGVLLPALPAWADNIISSPTGLASPGSTITFEEIPFPIGTPLSNQYAGLGATFSPGITYDPAPGHFPDASIGNYFIGTNFSSITNPVSLFFTSPVSAADFQFNTNTGGSTTFTALLSGLPVASFSAPTDASFLWFGFSNLTFNQIEINVDATTTNGAFLLDNLQFNRVPEPASLALLGTGLIALAGFMRRRTRP
jgi:hypothetical protein